MDMQALVNAISASGRVSRSNYHLTLGALREALDGLPDDALVVTDTGCGIGDEHSYRGYYDDLSFEAVESSTVAEVRQMCDRAGTQEYEGYKGGDFRYDDKTPLWLAPYGCCGLAIINAVRDEDRLRLITRVVD